MFAGVGETGQSRYSVVGGYRLKSNRDSDLPSWPWTSPFLRNRVLPLATKVSFGPEDQLLSNNSFFSPFVSPYRMAGWNISEPSQTTVYFSIQKKRNSQYSETNTIKKTYHRIKIVRCYGILIIDVPRSNVSDDETVVL